MNSCSYGLPQEAVKQFRDLCEKRSIQLNEVEATKEANSFFGLFMTLVEKPKEVKKLAVI